MGARFAAHQCITTGPYNAVVLPAPVVDAVVLPAPVVDLDISIGAQLHHKALTIAEDLNSLHIEDNTEDEDHNTMEPKSGDIDEEINVGTEMDLSAAFWGWAAYISEL